MKTQMRLKNSPSENIHLKENKVTSIKRRYFSIRCLSGSLWITWPNGLEQFLTGGQIVSGKTRGKVCIMALSDATIQVKQKHISWYSAFWGWIPREGVKVRSSRLRSYDPAGRYRMSEVGGQMSGI